VNGFRSRPAQKVELRRNTLVDNDDDVKVIGILKIRKLTVFAVAFVLSAAQSTHGHSAYLQQIGPPPLRFAIGAAMFSFNLPLELRDRVSPTNSTEIAATKPASTATNSLALATASPSPSTNAFTIPPLPEPRDTTLPVPTASDMLVISPQMLTEYFKPGPDGTNSPNTVIVPVPVGFTPPLATPSSKATYKVQ
jgi:hypothetical protein